jgi:hypothetical protein
LISIRQTFLGPLEVPVPGHAFLPSREDRWTLPAAFELSKRQRPNFSTYGPKLAKKRLVDQ